MQITIGTHTIRATPHGYAIYETRKAGPKAKDPGRDYRVKVGDYSSLAAALRSIPDKVVRGSGVKGFEELRDEADALSATMDSLAAAIERVGNIETISVGV